MLFLKLKVHSYLMQFMALLPKMDDKAPEMEYQPQCSLYQQVNVARLQCPRTVCDSMAHSISQI
jgi:hypothetical protein